MSTKISVVVPSKGGQYLSYLLPALGRQSVRPDEVVLVLKDCDLARIERLCRSSGLPPVILEQRDGYVTRAYNMGKDAAGGDVVIFTDDDAIPPDRWVENHLMLHRHYGEAGCISSRDVLWALGKGEVDTPAVPRHVRVPRWFTLHRWVRQLLFAPPHPLLKKYRYGLYLTKDLEMAWGPHLPYRVCYSTPYKGVNMSFKREALQPVFFPEHPLVRRGFGFEQHVSLQLILRGVDCIYVPNNPVRHIVRESLSRTSDPGMWREIELEFRVMQSMYADLIGNRLDAVSVAQAGSFKSGSR